MEELLELYKQKSKTDGYYAIAFAILWNARDKRTANTLDVDILAKLTAWLRPRQGQDVCNPQLWQECLGRTEVSYTLASARAISRAMNEVGGWALGSAKRFEKYGVQKAWVFMAPKNDLLGDDAPLDDL